ncbi:MAG TPA: type II toxin-antitoxin system VapC family toxin [Phycisphaerae bacterium]|nr:type II toxin-antitoxin system VapC family toxin [Phycisphaerae bacterium]
MTVLDTNILIYLLEGRLQDELPGSGLCLSVITEIELLSYSRLTEDQKARIQDMVTRLTVIGLTPQVKEAAIQLRRVNRLTIPDAIVAATALSLGAELLTNDDKLMTVPGLACRRMNVAPP